jgi:hypothetical protein
MKYTFFIILISLSIFSENGNAQNNTGHISSSEIIGKWQLQSFKMDGKTVNYVERNINWSFDGKHLSVESDDIRGRISGKYYFRRSVFRKSATYVLKCNALTKTHLPYGKLVIQSVTKNKLVMKDWDDKLSYTLKRVE